MRFILQSAVTSMAWLVMVAATTVADPVEQAPAAPTSAAQSPATDAKDPAATGAAANPGATAAAAAATGDQFDDAPEPFVPLHPRDGREDDRVRAMALFAAARVAEQKQDFPTALRNYQRAFRFDSSAVTAVREIVPLAFNLDRQLEAVRYALILAERESTDPVLLRRLAIYLTEEGDTDRALKLYEKTLAVQAKAKSKPTPDEVILWMEMGRLYFLAKKYDQAANHFSNVVKALDSPKEYGLEPTMQKALLNKAELTYQLFGESFLEANRVDDAVAAFEKSRQIKADEPLQLYNQARIDVKRNQPAQALAKLEAYFDKRFATQGTGPYHLYAEVLGIVGQDDQLLPRLEKYGAADPENMPLAYFMAERYRQAKQFDKAEPIYQALLGRNKSRPPVEAFQGLTEVYRQQKDAKKLLAILGETAGRGGGTLSPLGDAGKSLVADTEQVKAVVEAARKQADEDPAKLSYGECLAAGALAVDAKDFAAADRFFELALKAENSKPSEALVTWGLDLFSANQYAAAVKIFQRGLDEKLLPENNPNLHFYLAGALAMDDRTDEALVAARKAAELQADSPRFLSRVGWIEYHAKRFDDARKSYEALLEKFDKKHDSPETRDVMRDARLVLSNISVAQEKTAESEEWLEQVLDEFPADVGALNDLGYLWADSGKHLELAREMVQTASVNEPKNMAYRDSMGWVLFRLGRYPEAIAELKIAASVDEPDGVIFDHLAEAQFAAGDHSAAAENWRRAAELFEKKSEPEKARQTRDKLSRKPGATAPPPKP